MICWEAPKYIKLLIIFTLVGVQNSYAQALDSTIKISKRFPENRMRLISQDLAHLLKMPNWNSLSENEKKVLEIESADNHTVFKWMDARIGFLVPKENEVINGFSYGGSFEDYPSKDTFPKDLSSLFLFTDHTARTLMSNPSVSYYFAGKVNARIARVDLSHHFDNFPKPISIYSPRVGIIFVHDDFFKSHLYISPFGRKSADRILRLSHLFHEARHSDGNGKSLGFYHMKCPPGTDYAGQFACDRASNGAYTIGSIFIKKSLEVCRDCTEEEKDSLRIYYFDSQSRVMNKKILTPEDVEKINQLENQLDHTAHQLFQVVGENQSERTRILEKEIQNILSEIKEIKAFDEKSQAEHWDATPEVIGIYHE